jgi:glutamate synthase (NADPH/NADH) large chain
MLGLRPGLCRPSPCGWRTVCGRMRAFCALEAPDVTTLTGPSLYDPSFDHDACGVGFIAQIQGVKSQAIVSDALSILERMAHRGATGCDPCTGDGAGILVQISNRFFQKRVREDAGCDLPGKKRYGVGMIFLPTDPEARAACEAAVEAVIEAEGQRLVGWRDVPVDPTALGPVARGVMPVIRQVFIARRRCVPTAFNRRLYVIRKLAEHRVRADGIDPQGMFHIASLSADTIVYKGLLTSEQLRGFFLDLSEPDFVSAIALVHSRFSTNTFPTWDRAQPRRYLCHNGEINTLRGNRNWMRARRALLQSAKFSGGLERLQPIIEDGGSDSAQFDDMLELLFLGGRSLPHAMMMMIPEAWEGDEGMDPSRRAFYDYTSSLMEPWDGPAAICFTDGALIGATLDRNGLRPARWLETVDGRVVLASETGVIDVPAADIRRKGRLKPGRMLIVDTVERRILDDDAVKSDIVARFPYGTWLARNGVPFSSLRLAPAAPALTGEALFRAQAASGWTDEDLRVIVAPMAETGAEPTGSMGFDAPLAVLSDQAPSLFSFVKQLFAQVTNPPIDPIRERLVMSLRTAIGGGGNPFDETPEACHRLTVEQPILTNAELATLMAFQEGTFETRRLDTVFDPNDGRDPGDALRRAVERLCQAAADAVDEGWNILVLSDRALDARWAPIPSLLAVSAVHQRLVREGTRLLTGLVVETAEAREVHHFACLRGFGAGVVNPWLLFDTLEALHAAGELAVAPEVGAAHVTQAVGKGLLKVMSKMGISTMSSYTGAQIFEIVGLSREIVDEHFTGTPSRIGGLGWAQVAAQALARHGRAFGPDRLDPDLGLLPVGGLTAWRRTGERHVWTPASLASLQQAVRADDARAWAAYREAVCGGELVAGDPAAPMTLRELLEIRPIGPPVRLEEVEPVAGLVQRFVSGAMSFGSISAEAHETLAIAMNRLGGRSNSGEGGEEARRGTPDPDGSLRRSAIKQVASARFGVHAAYLASADELQIKIAQGAKPGEGGQLPGHKVTERIAAVRCSTPGVTLISPPPHHDIYSIEDLAQLIHDLKIANPRARVSVKLVSEVGVGTIAAGVAKARADAIIVAGAAGGTGASPLSSIQHAGLPWELGLAETQQVLVDNDLRGRVRLQVDGGLRSARDVLVAALLGAEEFGVATAALVAMGCVLLRKCHQNTCSVGIATQDPELVARFAGDPEHVVRFFTFLAEDLRTMLAAVGARSLDEVVGRADALAPRADLVHDGARTLDLQPVLAIARPGEDVARRHARPQEHPAAAHLDQALLRAVREGLGEDLDGAGPVTLHQRVTNGDRSVGALLSGEVARVHGAAGLPDDTVHIDLEGSAGQSFGAFLARGITLSLVGDANDGVGKGLSGGRLVIRPPDGARFAAEDNVLLGNVALYGATGGEAFFRGIAGERFAVRNSGARAVVEGVGDHGCEYMTGGVVVVLGATGRNFAAGMSGGTAYVFDRDGALRSRVNPELVELEALVEEADLWLVSDLLEAHLRHTGSVVAERLLDNWETVVPRFVKVMPVEYKRVLQARRARRRGPPGRGLSEAAAGGGGLPRGAVAAAVEADRG